MVVINALKYNEVDFGISSDYWIMVTIHSLDRFEVWSSSEPSTLGTICRTYESFKRKISHKDIAPVFEKNVIIGIFGMRK